MMQMMHVMTRHPETIRPGDTLLKAKEMMDAGGFRRIPVLHEGSSRWNIDRARSSRAWGPLMRSS
jgi:CBS domain-containing protein